MSEQNKKSGFIPYIFLIFFAIIFIVDSFYIYLANKSWRGVATQDSYQKGLKYNETLEYVKLQKNLGWKFDIKFISLENNVGELKVCLNDKNKKTINDAKIVAKLTRPTQEGFDFEQNLIPQNNCYFAKINFPLKGQWSFEIQAFKGDKILQETKRYIIR